MSNILWKYFNLCFSHLKCFPTSLPTPSSPKHHHPLSSSSLFSSSDTSGTTTDSPSPDLASVFASNRFFFSSPGPSNSILRSPEQLSGGVPVETDSPNPYLDFRRSMQEMVEAREYNNVEEDWDFLHELLLCYLMLNPKHTHKFIVGAFSDLLVSLMASSGRRKIDCRFRNDLERAVPDIIRERGESYD